MNNLLVKLMLIAALAQLGISASDFLSPWPKSFQKSLERKSKEVLQINWKPDSIFLEEANEVESSVYAENVYQPDGPTYSSASLCIKPPFTPAAVFNWIQSCIRQCI
jgi:hypothetical protein